MPSNPAALDAETVTRLESFVDEWLTTSEVPGASVAVTDADGVLYAKGFGARDLQSNTPATPETLYGVASITKPFTATAVMRLVEDGGLSLTDPVDEYVDYLADAPGEPITVAELLSHTSGMPSDDVATVLGPRLRYGQGSTAPVSSRDDMRRHIDGAADRRLTDRDRVFYYNSGYLVLGELVSAVAGRPYTEVVTDEVLEPLGMTRSTFDEREFEDADDRMTPYVRDADGFEPVPFEFDEHIHADGGLLSSVTELARFVRLFLNDGRGDEERLLAASSVAAMTEPRGEIRTLVDGTPEHYCLGLMRRGFGTDTLLGHGGTISSAGYLGWLADAGLGVALLCNTAPETHPMEVGPAVLGIAQGLTPAEANPYYAVREKLARVAGRYESYRGLQTATVEPEGLTLELTFESSGASRSLTCFPETAAPGDYRFYTVTGKLHRLTVEFLVDEGGADAVDLLVERNRLTKTA